MGLGYRDLPYVRSLTRPDPIARQLVSDVVFATEDEWLALGDADGELLIPCPSVEARVIISTENPKRAGLEDVWFDLVSADSESSG